MSDITLYRHPLSGHAHRVELLLAMLNLHAKLVDVDLPAGAHKAPEFLQKNPFGQVPVLEDGDVTVADSNAILVFLALKYDPSGTWYPRDAVVAARIQQWLSVAAGQLAYGPAAARMIKLFHFPLDYDASVRISGQLFAVLEQTLETQQYLAGGTSPTIADLAIYAYTAHAPEGEISLEPYPSIRAWIARIEALPGFSPMVRLGG